MAFRKYQKVEGEEVLTPEDHQTIGKALRKAGKTSMRGLDAEELQQVADALDDDANSTSR